MNYALQPRTHNATQTFRNYGLSKLLPLFQAVGLEAQAQQFLPIFNTLLANWGEQTVGTSPRWASEVTYDHTPMELSVALNGDRPEVRLLIEAQGNPTTIASSWAAGCQLNRSLAAQFGVSLERFDQIQDLFEPNNPDAGFAMFHAAGISELGTPEFKVYLNPFASRDVPPKILIQTALERLGFAQAWNFLSEAALRRETLDHVVFFSLDLTDRSDARVKIYVAHQDPRLDYLESVMAACPTYVPGDVTRFSEALLGEVPLGHRPFLTYFAFTSDNDAKPHSASLYLPLRDYAINDAILKQRIVNFLPEHDRTIYEAALAAIVDRPLEAGVGLHSFASLTRVQGQPRSVIYFAPEAYQVLPPRNA